MSQRLLSVLTSTVLFFIFATFVFSQTKQSKWFYLATSAEGWKFYYQKETLKLENGGLGLWTKVVYQDGSSMQMFDEWRCAEKRYRIIEATSFSPNSQILDGEKNLSWNQVSPDSVSEILFAIVCERRTETRKVEVIVLEANLRSRPSKDAPVLRTAKKESKFSLSLAKPFSGWYNVVDDETQEDYWIHGNTVKIVENKAVKKKNDN
jgi:hypothetical protein